jgi:hypothetical protein
MTEYGGGEQRAQDDRQTIDISVTSVLQTTAGK